MIWARIQLESLWKSPAFSPSASQQTCYLGVAMPNLSYWNMLHSHKLWAETKEMQQHIDYCQAVKIHPHKHVKILKQVNLSIFELLLNILDDSPTFQALKGPLK